MHQTKDDPQFKQQAADSEPECGFHAFLKQLLSDVSKMVMSPTFCPAKNGVLGMLPSSS
jgi:hypothetical protein